MKVLKTITEVKAEIKVLRAQGKTIGFVPTMGYLHQGHLSLVETCRKENDIVIASLFVNPAQFGPNEDLDRYPRDYERDEALLKERQVDLLFYPGLKEIYPDDFVTYVNVEKITGGLCGRSRSGHFRGVATVVLKLFNIVMPDVAYFGQKDAQQATVIKRMVKDLNLDVKVKALPIIRDEHGLALSSRNVYLSPEEHAAALHMPRALNEAREQILSGQLKNAAALREFILTRVRESSLVRIDYIEIVALGTLEPYGPDQQVDDRNTLVAAAIYVGKTRLIDNFILGEI